MRLPPLLVLLACSATALKPPPGKPQLSRLQSASASGSTLGTPTWLPAFSTAALGGLLFGSDIGASSSVVRILGSGATEFGAMDPLALGMHTRSPDIHTHVTTVHVCRCRVRCECELVRSDDRIRRVDLLG